MRARLPAQRPRKRFGQNFLHDRGTIERIIRAVDPRPGDALVEIGPGRGAITIPMLSRAESLIAVELDRDLVPLIRAACDGLGNLQVIQADAMALDFCSLNTGLPLRLVGNLPYNISTPLLFHLLGQAGCIGDMHFMLQREVVERMAAQPGGRTYGRLSVTVQYRCKVESLFTVGPKAFRPAPAVESAFVRLTPYQKLPWSAQDEGALDRVIRATFAQRRKTLRNSLHGLLSADEMTQAGIDPSLRPELLNVASFVRLADRLAQSGRNDS